MNVAWCCGCLRNTIVFAAEDCESYWRGCIQAAIVICQQIFALSALLIFLLFLLFKVLQNCLFSALASRSVLELLLPTLLRVVLLCFCNSVSADRIVMAA